MLAIILRLEFFDERHGFSKKLFQVLEWVSDIELAAVGVVDVRHDFVNGLSITPEKLGAREVCEVGRGVFRRLLSTRCRTGLLLFFQSSLLFLPFFFLFLFALLHQPEEDKAPFRKLEIDGSAKGEFLSIADQVELVVGEIILFRSRGTGAEARGCKCAHEKGNQKTNPCEMAHFVLRRGPSAIDLE